MQIVHLYVSVYFLEGVVVVHTESAQVLPQLIVQKYSDERLHRSKNTFLVVLFRNLAGSTSEYFLYFLSLILRTKQSKILSETSL